MVAEDGKILTLSPVTSRRHRRKTRYRRTALASAGIVAVAALTSGHLWSLYRVPSDSMSPTIAAGATVVAISWPWPAKVGDVVTFPDPGGDATMVKRVAAAAGDVLACCVARGLVMLNGASIPETYTAGSVTGAFGPLLVGPGQLLVLGDHRIDSQDSRVWGPVAATTVQRRVVAVLWPPAAAGPVR